MSIVSRMPLDRSSSFGAGNFGIRKLRKWTAFFPFSNHCMAGPWEEAVGADKILALPLNSTCASSSSWIFVGDDDMCRGWVEFIAVRAAQIRLH